MPPRARGRDRGDREQRRDVHRDRHGPRTRRPRSPDERSRCRKLGHDHAPAGRGPRRPAVRHGADRGRVPAATTDAAHHRAAGTDGGARRRRRRTPAVAYPRTIPERHHVRSPGRQRTGEERGAAGRPPRPGSHAGPRAGDDAGSHGAGARGVRSARRPRRRRGRRRGRLPATPAGPDGTGRPLVRRLLGRHRGSRPGLGRRHRGGRPEPDAHSISRCPEPCRSRHRSGRHGHLRGRANRRRPGPAGIAPGTWSSARRRCLPS